MSTPKYDALKAKVRDWSNKREVATIPESVIEDCLKYSADECYQKLRIPPLEASVQYTVAEADNQGEFTIFDVPDDLTQFNYIRATGGNFGDQIVFNEISDKRTFLDPFAEQYGFHRWMWSNNQIYIYPKQEEDQTLEINYYRRLPALGALYTVAPINYIIGLSDTDQPFLDTSDINDGTALYFAGQGTNERAFATLVEAQAYALTQPIQTVITRYYTGKEVDNWLVDQNERLLIWGALKHVGAYLFDEVMEVRYEKKFLQGIEDLNKEEKWRRALGGNVRINVNSGNLI
jgi:hypothetical protein